MASIVVGNTAEGKINYDGIQYNIDPERNVIKANSIKIERGIEAETPVVGKIGVTRIGVEADKNQVVRQMKVKGELKTMKIKDPDIVKKLKAKARKLRLLKAKKNKEENR
ncbi:MAG: hypothetical protein J6J36_07510 [Clostridia bacterium]|nr:hypothetical protein [Clostridia bacterium]